MPCIYVLINMVTLLFCFSFPTSHACRFNVMIDRSSNILRGVAGKSSWCILALSPEFDMAARAGNRLPSNENLASGAIFESLKIVTAAKGLVSYVLVTNSMTHHCHSPVPSPMEQVDSLRI